MSPEKRLVDLRIDLPHVPRPVASFVPWRRHKSLVFLASQNCVWNGVVVHRGKVGRDLDVDQGVLAARLCALNLVAALREAVGGNLERVTACVRIGGFVNCGLGFVSAAQVIDGASDFLHELFGPTAAHHARTAVGVVQLPQEAAVAVDAIFEVD